MDSGSHFAKIMKNGVIFGEMNIREQVSLVKDFLFVFVSGGEGFIFFVGEGHFGLGLLYFQVIFVLFVFDRDTELNFFILFEVDFSHFFLYFVEILDVLCEILRPQLLIAVEHQRLLFHVYQRSLALLPFRLVRTVLSLQLLQHLRRFLHLFPLVFEFSFPHRNCFLGIPTVLG